MTEFFFLWRELYFITDQTIGLMTYGANSWQRVQNFMTENNGFHAVVKWFMTENYFMTGVWFHDRKKKSMTGNKGVSWRILNLMTQKTFSWRKMDDFMPPKKFHDMKKVDFRDAWLRELRRTVEIIARTLREVVTRVRFCDTHPRVITRWSACVERERERERERKRERLCPENCAVITPGCLVAWLREFRRTLEIIARPLHKVVNRVRLCGHHTMRCSRSVLKTLE